MGLELGRQSVVIPLLLRRKGQGEIANILGTLAEEHITIALQDHFLYDPDITVTCSPHHSIEDKQKRDIIISYGKTQQTVLQVGATPWTLQNKLHNDGVQKYNNILLIPAIGFDHAYLKPRVITQTIDIYRYNPRAAKHFLWKSLSDTSPAFEGTTELLEAYYLDNLPFDPQYPGMRVYYVSSRNT